MSTNSHFETDLGKNDSILWCRCTKSIFFWSGIAGSALAIFLITGIIIGFVKPQINYIVFGLWYTIGFGITTLFGFGGFYLIKAYCKKEDDFEGKDALLVGFAMMIIAISALIISANYIDEDWERRNDYAIRNCDYSGYSCNTYQNEKYDTDGNKIELKVEEPKTLDTSDSSSSGYDYIEITNPIELEITKKRLESWFKDAILLELEIEKGVTSQQGQCNLGVYHSENNNDWTLSSRGCIPEVDEIWDSLESFRDEHT